MPIKTFRCLWSALLLAVLGLSILSSSQATAETKNVYSLDIFDSIEQGGTIHLCRVISRSQRSDEADRMEFGIAKLKVERTLRGADREFIDLPYGFSRVGAPPLNTVWPNLDGSSGSNLLCVVVPDAVDPTISSSNFGITEAASKVVFASDNKNDKETRRLSLMCDIYDASKSRTSGGGVLRQYVLNPAEEIRYFALRATINNYGTVWPDDAADIIRSWASLKGKDQVNKFGEARWLVNNILRQLTFSRSEAQTRFLFRCLVAVSQAPSDDVRNEAIRGLQQAVMAIKFLHPQTTNVLSEPDKTRLESVLNSALKSKDLGIRTNSVFVKEWMSR